MDIFENADSSLRFQKIRVPTYRIRIVFARLHENAKPMDMRLNSLRDMRCIMYDIEKPAFSKISTPRIVFENLYFGAQKRRLLVDGRLKRIKKLSFQNICIRVDGALKNTYSTKQTCIAINKNFSRFLSLYHKY